ncbi:MAG: Eco57I restriction-modification methylase domain-containing protein, partial [Acidobacteriaceae bacterium]|nr:Eco57I restriction-modification methylase domain-containing protein [Acidobacteriaceae bacterium]
MLRHAVNQPDILDVISDLSSDEVFTPPKVANAVLDLLPKNVWSNPDLRWLDPGSKTGVFLREIAKRLMGGLTEAIPDEQERIEHIMRKMVFGIAITELTALMSRRTLYCSKKANGSHAVVKMPNESGNVWMARVEHRYADGRCLECAASQAQMERDNRENHAYGFIHARGRAAAEKENGMKFDVIVGNPPYHMDSDGNNRTMPIYNLFVEQAKNFNPRYIAMIIPSRWMATGLGLTAFRSEMLGDRRIRKLVDFPNAAEVFPGVDIKSGVCYFLWDRDEYGDCSVTVLREGKCYGPVDRVLGEYDILVRDSRALEILHKVQAKEEASLIDILAADKEFGLTSNFSDYKTKPFKGAIDLHLSRAGKRIVGYIDIRNVHKSAELIDTWKVLLPQAGPGNSGGHVIPDMVLGPSLVVPPPSVCTQTYLFVWVDSELAARSVSSYLKTRFARFLISLRKISQHATRSTYTWVPQQPWNKVWTDPELYNKYDITEE